MLSLYLTAWFALFPILQVAHLTFADHGHRFCNEHLQIEDVPLEHGLVHDSLRVSQQPSLSDHTPDEESLRHIACSILNHKETREPLLATCQPVLVTYVDQFHPLTFIRSEDISPYRLLFSAPKTSPPILAA